MLKLNYTGLEVAANGLSASFRFNQFKLMKFMAEDTRATPMGLLTAMNERAKKETVWFRPDFFFQESKQNKEITNNFLLGSNYRPNEMFYDFLKSNVQSINKETKMVELSKWINWKIDVTYIGRKTFTILDTITTDKGDLLGTVEMTYGNPDLKTRKLQAIVPSAAEKSRLIETSEHYKQPYIPEFIKVPKNIPKYCIIHKVSSTAIDNNNHANFSYYMDLALKAFYKVPVGDIKSGLNRFKDFSILYKDECICGDVIKSVAWYDPMTDFVYCHLVRNTSVLTFVCAKVIHGINVRGTAKL